MINVEIKWVDGNGDEHLSHWDGATVEAAQQHFEQTLQEDGHSFTILSVTPL